MKVSGVLNSQELEVLDAILTGGGLLRGDPSDDWVVAGTTRVLSEACTGHLHRLVRMGFLRIRRGSLQGLTNVELHPAFVEIRYEWEVLRSAGIVVPPARLNRWRPERLARALRYGRHPRHK